MEIAMKVDHWHGFFKMENDRRHWLTLFAAVIALPALPGCSHVAFTHAPPRTSVEVALAKRAVAVPTPAPRSILAANAGLPDSRQTMTETIADYFTLGNLMMQQENYPDAIKAYENAVKLDPGFSDAWNHLAICYQNSGQNGKAIEAFKKYKVITRQQ